MKAALKVLETNKSSGKYGIPIELFQATETEFVNILINTYMSTNMKNKQKLAYRLEMFNTHLNFQERRCQGVQ